MITLTIANRPITPTPENPLCQVWGKLNYWSEVGRVQLVTADNHVLFDSADLAIPSEDSPVEGQAGEK